MKKNAAIELLEARIAPAVLFAVELNTNKLVSFDSTAPGTLLSDVAISGLPAGSVIGGIDFNVRTGELVALGVVDDGNTRTAKFYTVDPVTGTATQSGSMSITLGDTGAIGFDYDPSYVVAAVTDALDGNYRISAGISGEGTSLNDPNQGESITAIAFDRPYAGAGGTLYGYNFTTDQLVTIGDIGGSPAHFTDGVVKPIARAKLGGANFVSNNSSGMGFDIGGNFGQADVGWIAMIQNGSPTPKLYNIDLTTAALTELGTIGDGTRVFSGISVRPDAPAPTISADGKTATWTDLDGDAVTMKVTKGTLTAANFRMLAGAGGTSALSKLTLTDAAFAGTNVTFKAKPGASGGDGRVNVGEINAIGLDLGNVTVPGDLIAIDAGDNTAPAPSIKALTVGSMAAFGTALLGNPFSFESNLAEGAGKITIAGDFAARLNNGEGRTGSITIGGNVRDMGFSNSGQIANFGAGSIGKLVVKGSVLGGASNESASIYQGGIGSVFIGGSIVGGDGNSSGVISMTGSKNATITVGGSVIGGDGNRSGVLRPGTSFTTVKVGGSILGSGGMQSGILSVDGKAAVTIAGDVRGGAGVDSGSIADLFGNARTLKSLTIGGSVVSGDNALQIAVKSIGAITIKGSIAGTADAPVNITAESITAPATAAESIGIGKLTVGGNGKTADAAIGAVKIGGNFIASSITAGIDPVNGKLGDADDQFVGGNSGNASIVAKIASITIGGQLLGTVGGVADSFGIIAEEVGALTVGKIKIPLTAAKDDLTVGFTGDVRVREL
jgi:hypothetical protein